MIPTTTENVFGKPTEVTHWIGNGAQFIDPLGLRSQPATAVVSLRTAVKKTSELIENQDEVGMI